MIILAVLCAVLILLILALVLQLNKRTVQKAQLEKQEKREWLIKIALEQSCRLPSVEAEELAPIEPELDRLMNSAERDPEAEEKMRELIMGLYEAKVNKKTPAKTNNPPPPPPTPPITGRGR